MNENLVTSLFNRVILDTIVGGLLLILIQMSASTLGADPLRVITSSSLAKFTPFILVVAAYLCGTILDKAAYLLLDRMLFSREFGERRSSFEIPSWCREEVEKGLPPTARLPSLDRTQIDESSADWITALFYAAAPVDSQAKRRDLVANFQFISNLLAAAMLGTVVLPIFIGVSKRQWPWAIAALILLGAAVAALWRFSVVSLRRLHTFENLVVFGMFLSRRPPFAESYGAGLALPSQSTKSRRL